MDKLTDILTDEEYEFLQKIEQKIIDNLALKNPESEKEIEELTSFENNSELVHPEKISDAPVEIMFNIKAIVSETDENGQPKETINLLDKFYHIPIVNGRNYEEYMNKFLENFHSKLEQTCQELQKNE
jgi:hypothetical protein